MVGLDFLSMRRRQFRFGIECINMRHAAGHKQENDVLRLGWEMRISRGKGITGIGEQLLYDAGKQQRSHGGRT